MRHFTDENGLPQNSVKGIAPDKDGFVWLATEDGLVRFDGTKFISFGVAQLKVSSSRFQTFFPGVADTGLYTYNIENEYLTIKNGKPGKLPTGEVILSSQIYYGDKGGVKSKLFRLDGLTNRKSWWRHYLPTIIFRNSASSGYRYENDSVSYYTGDKRIYQYPFQPLDQENFFLIGDQLYHLSAEGSVSLFNPICLGTCKLTGDLQTAIASTGTRTHIRVLWNVCIRDFVLLYSEGTFYLARPNQSGDLVTKALFSNTGVLFNDIISAYYDDKIDRLYLGGFTKGLYILDHNSFSTFTSEQSDNVFYGHTVAGDQILTAAGYIFDLRGNSSSVASIGKATSGDNYSIVTGSDGSIFTKSDEWLHKLASGSFKRVYALKLPSRIALLNAGADNMLYIASKSKAIFWLDMLEENPIATLFATLPEAVTSLQQYEGSLYAGTSNGLYKISIATKHIIHFNGLNNRYVSSIYCDANSNIWVTTHGHGFSLLSHNKVTSFPLDKQQFIATAHCVVDDHKGFLWISTNKGLFQIAKADLLSYANGGQHQVYYHYHDRNEGFNTNEFNGNCAPCGIQLPNGTISFPSINGLVVFQPQNIATPFPDAALFVDRIELDGQIIATTDVIQVPHKFRQLNLFVSTPFMGNSNNLSLEYSLVTNGDPPIWLPLSEDGIIDLNTLPSGDFELTIRKLKGFGKDQLVQKTIRLSIAKAWYQTIWFYVGTCLLLTIFVWTIIRLRIRLIEKRNWDLEAMVADKTHKLERQTEVQDMIIRSISHDVQTPLQYQVLLSKSIYDGLLSGNYKDLSTQANVLNSGTQRLHYMVGNLLNYLKVQKTEVTNRMEEMDLYELIAEKLMIFESIARERKTVLTNHVSPGSIVFTDIQILSIILHNLLDNAVKVTKNGSIDINVNIAGNQYDITITDTGPGLPLHLQHWINGAINKEELAHENNHTTGIGLHIIMEMIVLVNLRLQVAVDPNGGSCFTITGTR